MANELTGRSISSTYLNLLQLISGSLYTGAGVLISTLNISSSGNTNIDGGFPNTNYTGVTNIDGGTP